VRKADCKIVHICNWSSRKFVVTFPDLIYWFEWTGIFQLLRQGIETLCCRPFREGTIGIRDTTTAVPSPGEAVSAAAPTNTSPFAALLSQSWLNKDRTIDAGTLGLALLGITDSAGQPLATQFEQDNPGPFLFIDQVLRPTLESALPSEVVQLLAELAARKEKVAAAATTPPADELAALRQAVTELQTTVRAQADEIERLKNR
jgi:hypothetical protein